MANDTPSVNGGDPAIQRQVDRQTAGLLPKGALAAAPSISSPVGTSTKATPSSLTRSIAPIVNGAETIYPQSTASTNTNSVTITSSVNNIEGDVTTVYTSGSRISVNPINQTINQYTAVDSGVSAIVAGNGVTISSTGGNGKGVVTVNFAGGNIGNVASINLDGNVANVLHGDGSWSADQTTYGNSNVAGYLPTYNGVVQASEVTTTGDLVLSSGSTGGNWHYTYYANGLFETPSNVNFLGTRLNLGYGSQDVSLVNPTFVSTLSGGNYIQAALINESATGSSDWAAYGANGDDTQGWVDMGFTSHGFNDANYTITDPGSGYIFSQGYANGIGGHLTLATGNLGNTPDIVFATGGFLSNNEFARIDHANNVFHLTRANSGIQFADGTIQTTASGGGNPFDQDLNTTDNVTFANVTSTDTLRFSNSGNIVGALGYAPNYVSIEGYQSNSVVITANDVYTWTFGSDGLTTLPDGAIIDTTGNNFEVRAIENVNFEANAVVNIYTDSSNNGWQWQFDDNGQFNLAGGGSIIKSIANSSLDPTLPNVSTMVLTPDSNYNSQVLVLDPTAPGHIHLRAYAFSNIDEPAANIFLGGENTSFEITQGANNQARIHSGGNTWAFGTDGVLTLPGNTAVIEGSANLVTIYSDSGSSLDYLLVSSNNVTEVVNQGNVQITSNNNGTSRTWEFDSNGTLTAPGDITVSGDITGTAGANTLVLKAQPTTDTYIQLNSIVDSTISIAANLEIVTDSSNTSQSWTFDNTGNLTTGNIIFGNSSRTYIYYGANNYINLNNDGAVDVSANTDVKITTNYGDSPNRAYSYFYANGTFESAGAIIANNIGNVAAANLDGSSSNVLYGNGVFAPAAGGSSNAITNGNSTVAIASIDGNISVTGASSLDGSGNIGSVVILAGSGNTTAGNVAITSGDAANGAPGTITLRGGNTDSSTDTAGNVSIYSGYNSNASGGYGGNILISAGTGNTSNGNIKFSTSGSNVVTVTEYNELFVDGTFLLGDYTGTNAQATIQVAAGDPRMILANYANGNASSAYYPDRILFGTDDYFGSIGQNQGYYISNTTTNSEINLNLFTGNGRIYINDGDNAGFYANGGSLQSYNASGNGFYSNTTIAYHTGKFSAPSVQANTAFQLPVYASNTARDTAIAAPATGMMVFVTGSGMQVYGATQWNSVSGTNT